MYRNRPFVPKPVPPVSVDSYSDVNTGRLGNASEAAFSTGYGQTKPAPDWYSEMLQKRSMPGKAKHQSTQDSYGSVSQNFGKNQRGLIDMPENTRGFHDRSRASRGLLDPPDVTGEYTDSMVTSGGLLDLPSSSSGGLLEWPDTSNRVLDTQPNYGAALSQQESYRGLLDRPESSRALLETPPSLLKTPDRSHNRNRSNMEPSSTHKYDYIEQADPEDYYYQPEQQSQDKYGTYETSQRENYSEQSADIIPRKTTTSMKNPQWQVDQTGESYNELIERAQAFSQERKAPRSSTAGMREIYDSNNAKMPKSQRQIKSLFSLDTAHQSKPISSREGNRSMSISPVNEMEHSEDFDRLEKSIYNGPAGQLVTNYYCKVCKIRANSMNNFILHCEGRQHNKIVSELRAFLGPEFARTYGNPNEPNVCREPLDQDNDESQYEDGPSNRATQVKSADASVPAFQTNMQGTMPVREDRSRKRERSRDQRERASSGSLYQKQGHSSRDETEGQLDRPVRRPQTKNDDPAIEPEKLANMSKILDAVGIRDEESLANLVAAAVKSVVPNKDSEVERKSVTVEPKNRNTGRIDNKPKRTSRWSDDRRTSPEPDRMSGSRRQTVPSQHRHQVQKPVHQGNQGLQESQGKIPEGQGRPILDQNLRQIQFDNRPAGHGLLGPAPMMGQRQLSISQNQMNVVHGQGNIPVRPGLLNVPMEMNKLTTESGIGQVVSAVRERSPSPVRGRGLLGSQPLMPQVVNKTLHGPVTASVTSEELEVARQFGQSSGVQDMAVLLQAVRLVKQLDPQVISSLGNLKAVVAQLQMGQITLQDASKILPGPVVEMIANGTMGPQLIQLLTGGIGNMVQNVQPMRSAGHAMSLFELNVAPTKRMRECSPLRRPKKSDAPRRPGALAAALGIQGDRDRSPHRRDSKNRDKIIKDKGNPRRRNQEPSTEKGTRKDKEAPKKT